MNPGIMSTEDLQEASTDLGAGYDASEGIEKLVAVTVMGDKLDEASSILETVDSQIATFQEAADANIEMDPATLDITRTAMEHFYRRLDTPRAKRVPSLEAALVIIQSDRTKATLLDLQEFRGELSKSYAIAEEAYGLEVQSIVEYHENQKTAVMSGLNHLKGAMKREGTVGKPLKHTRFLNDLGSFRGEVTTAEVLKAFQTAHQAVVSLHLPEVLASMTQGLEKIGAAAKEGKEGVSQDKALGGKLDGFDKAFRRYANTYLGNRATLKYADEVQCLDIKSAGDMVQEAERFMKLHDEIVRGLEKFSDTAEKVGHMLDPQTQGTHFRNIFKIFGAVWLLAWGAPGILLAGGALAVFELLAVMGIAWSSTRLDKMRNKTLDAEAKQDRAAGREGREFIKRVAEVLTHCEAVAGCAADYIHWSTK